MDALLDHPVPATFRALGDPVRCTIVEHLGAHGDSTVNNLAELFTISLQAVSKHIKVLEAAGVVSRRRDGRFRPVALEPGHVGAAVDWLSARRRQIDTRYERLDDVLADLLEGAPEP